MVEPARRRISFAIPTFKSTEFLPQALEAPLSSNLVTNVTICDDKTPGLSVRRLLDRVMSTLGYSGFQLVNQTPVNTEQYSGFMLEVSPQGPTLLLRKRITVVQQRSNRGAFLNKLLALELCSEEWAFLLDGDNFVETALIESFGTAPEPEKTTIYCPASLVLIRAASGRSTLERPYHQLFGVQALLERRLNIAFFSGLLSSQNRETYRTASFFLNTGNFFVHRSSYVDTVSKRLSPAFTGARSADVLAFAALWLESGGTFYLMKNQRYFHRLHEASYWSVNPSESQLSDFVQSITSHKTSTANWGATQALLALMLSVGFLKWASERAGTVGQAVKNRFRRSRS